MKAIPLIITAMMYVVRPEGSLTLKVRVNQSGDDIHAKGDKDGASSKADLKTDFKTTVSIIKCTPEPFVFQKVVQNGQLFFRQFVDI